MTLNLNQLIKVNGTILIQGETGTGKSKLAREVHHLGPRRHYPFISLNVGGMAESLFESELFGHKKGAFTGAYEDKQGFASAVGQGVLFLDEIGDLSLNLQKKLLFLLEEKLFYPLGSCKPHKFQGHVIVATHKNLEELMKLGEFREDLYYRLRVYQVRLKPFRAYSDREKESMIYELWNKINVEDKRIERSVVHILINHSFKGNVRELKHCLEYVYNLGSDIVTKEDLPSWIKDSKDEESSLDLLFEAQELNNSQKYADNLASFEKNFFYRRLIENQGRINETSRQIKMNKVTFLSKLKKYNIDAATIRYYSTKREVINL